MKILITCVFFGLFSQLSLAEPKPTLVLLPIEVSKEDAAFEDEFGAALQEGLQNRYEVFYGASVEKELEKEYSKVDCSAETCVQNVAIAFNGELIADASVSKMGQGYALKMVIRNVITGKVIETKTQPCRECDGFAVIEQLKNMGAGISNEGAISGSGNARNTMNNSSHIPKHARLNSSGDGWECVEGYTKLGQACVLFKKQQDWY